MIKRKYSYLLAYIILLVTPTILLFGFVKDTVNFKALLATEVMCFLLAGVFDYWGTRHGKKDKFYVWEYDDRSILGIKVFGLPIEDIIFFLGMMPITGVFIYEAAKILLK